MLRTVMLAGLMAGFIQTTAVAEDPPVFSGPQPGEKITPFKVQGVFGEEKSREFDFVKMAGSRPFLFLFLHTPTRPAGDLSRVLLHYAQTREEAGLFTALTYLSDDLTDARRKMVRAHGWWNCGPPAAISIDGAEGPGAYGLNRNVTMTILIGTQGKVTANFALIQPSNTDAAHIIPSINSLVGGSVPTVQEIEFLGFPSLLPPIVKQWRSGKAPTDIKLRVLMCRLLRNGNDPQQSALTLAEIDEYTAGKPELQAELGESARLVLKRNYGSRRPIIDHIPELTNQLSGWDEQFFAPPILAADAE